MDEHCHRVDLELHVVDEAERAARVLRVEITGPFVDNPHARAGAHELDKRSPAMERIAPKLDWRNVVTGVCGAIGLARHAVRRRLAGREPPVADAQVARPLAGAGPDDQARSRERDESPQRSLQHVDRLRCWIC